MVGGSTWSRMASALIPANGSGLHEVQLESVASLKAKTVILSTGARWRQMGVPGEDQYRNKGVAYCPHCDGPLFKGKRVAVIGGGNSGVEAAIDLAGIVAHVTLIEFDSQLRADEVLQRKLRSLPNVRIVTSGQTTEVLGGFYLIDVDSLDEAVRIARRHPGARVGTVEVRRVMELDGLPDRQSHTT